MNGCSVGLEVGITDDGNNVGVKDGEVGRGVIGAGVGD